MMFLLPGHQPRGSTGLPGRTLEATEICIVVGLLILCKKFTPAAITVNHTRCFQIFSKQHRAARTRRKAVRERDVRQVDVTRMVLTCRHSVDVVSFLVTMMSRVNMLWPR